VRTSPVVPAGGADAVPVGCGVLVAGAAGVVSEPPPSSEWAGEAGVATRPLPLPLPPPPCRFEPD
jgi:hypothetical protein